MAEILIRGAETVLTMDDAGTEAAGCDILIRDGVIASDRLLPPLHGRAAPVAAGA